MSQKTHIEGAICERNYVYNFHFHLIWVTKYRQKVFTTPILVDEMKEILAAIAILEDIFIEEMEVLPDHVHLLICFRPKYAVSDVVKALKECNAKCFFENHPEIKNSKLWGGHLWSHSYYMSTSGNMSKEVVEQYIRNQYKRGNS